MFALRLNPPGSAEDERLARVRQTIEAACQVQSQQSNRAANQLIIDTIGVLVRVEKDESYCEEALAYHLGLLYAHIGDWQLAAQYFERSGTHPGGGGNLLFSDHQYESQALRHQQEAAKKRGIPSVVIASMPRSGSASLVQTIAATLGIPTMRASCGQFPQFQLVPRWFHAASSGGAAFHDHFHASAENLELIRDGGITKLFVRVRDPRAAACSNTLLDWRTYGDGAGRTSFAERVLNVCKRRLIPWLETRIKGSSTPLDRQTYGDEPDLMSFQDRVLHTYQNAFIPWLEGWVAVDRDPEIHTEWLRFGGSNDEINQTARHVIATLARQHSGLEKYVGKSIQTVEANHLKGDDEAWRAHVSDEVQDRMWQATPDSVRDLLALRP